MSLSFLCPLVPLNPFASSSTSLLSPLAFQKKKKRFANCHMAVGSYSSCLSKIIMRLCVSFSKMEFLVPGLQYKCEHFKHTTQKPSSQISFYNFKNLLQMQKDVCLHFISYAGWFTSLFNIEQHNIVNSPSFPMHRLHFDGQYKYIN